LTNSTPSALAPKQVVKNNRHCKCGYQSICDRSQGRRYTAQRKLHYLGNRVMTSFCTLITKS